MADPRPFNYEYRRPRLDNRTYQSYNAFESLYHNGRVDRLPVPSQLMRQEHAIRHDLYNQNTPNPYTHDTHNNYTSRPRYSDYQPASREDQSVSRQFQPASRQYQPAPRHFEETGVNTDQANSRGGSNYSRRSKSSANSTLQQPVPQPVRASILSTYGTSSLNRGQTERPVQRQTQRPVQRQTQRPVQRQAERRVQHQQPAMNVSINGDYTSQIFARQQKPFNIINCYSHQAEPLKKYPKYTLQNLYYERGMDARLGV